MMTNLGKIDRYNELRESIGEQVTTNELVLLTLRNTK